MPSCRQRSGLSFRQPEVRVGIRRQANSIFIQAPTCDRPCWITHDFRLASVVRFQPLPSVSSTRLLCRAKPRPIVGETNAIPRNVTVIETAEFSVYQIDKPRQI